jgi:hypothetical protein
MTKLRVFREIDPDSIQPVDLVNAPVRVAIAAWIGKTWLIDNVLCEPPAPGHSLQSAQQKQLALSLPYE